MAEVFEVLLLGRVRVRVSVLALLALAELSAFQPRTVTLAVSFLAHRLLARAPAGRSQGRHSLEIAWVPQVSHHLCLIYARCVLGMVMTVCAFAVASTFAPIRETFAVKFQASNFGAFASVMLLLCFRRHTLFFAELYFCARLRIGVHAIFL